MSKYPRKVAYLLMEVTCDWPGCSAPPAYMLSSGGGMSAEQHGYACAEHRKNVRLDARVEREVRLIERTVVALVPETTKRA